MLGVLVDIVVQFFGKRYAKWFQTADHRVGLLRFWSRYVEPCAQHQVCWVDLGFRVYFEPGQKTLHHGPSKHISSVQFCLDGFRI